MAELGRTDIEARWLAHSLCFWNSLCAQPRGSLHYKLLMDAQSEALLVGIRNWVGGLRRDCLRLGYELPLSTQRARRVNVQYVLGLRAAQQQRAWEALSVCPRTCRTEGAAKCTYWRWSSRTPRQQVHLRIFRQRHSARRIGSYLRFEWLQHTASGDGQAGPHAQAPAALPAVRPRGGGRRAAHDC